MSTLLFSMNNVGLILSSFNPKNPNLDNFFYFL